RGPEIDDQLKFRRLHYRQVGRFFAFEYPAAVNAGLTTCIGYTCSVAHQATGRGKLAHRTFLVSDSMFGLVGFTSRPTFAAAGTSSCSNSNSFGGSRLPRKLTPVTLPPGRLRLATRPNLTGVAADHEDDRYRRARCLDRECRGGGDRGDRCHPTVNQIGCQH